MNMHMTSSEFTIEYDTLTGKINTSSDPGIAEFANALLPPGTVAQFFGAAPREDYHPLQQMDLSHHSTDNETLSDCVNIEALHELSSPSTESVMSDYNVVIKLFRELPAKISISLGHAMIRLAFPNKTQRFPYVQQRLQGPSPPGWPMSVPHVRPEALNHEKRTELLSHISMFVNPGALAKEIEQMDLSMVEREHLRDIYRWLLQEAR